MPLTSLSDWLDEQTQPNIIWFVKRLSGNDTLANNTHQAGPYIPKAFLFKVLSALNRSDLFNPKVSLKSYIDSHIDVREAIATWYNNKVNNNGTRNETRLTGFGGSASALLDPENTGAVAIFAFYLDETRQATKCHIWVCEDETEGDLVEDRIGPVEPGKYVIWPLAQQQAFASSFHTTCRLQPNQIPRAWLQTFPTGLDILLKAIELRSLNNLTVDQRLIKRRECEYQIFQSVEEAVELPRIQQGFQTINEFITHANSILQRRKARAGRSLELHVRQILIEEQFRDNTDFAYQASTEPRKAVDFLFPSVQAYKDRNFPAEKLRMLAVKTTCKDRWRQILNEADRIEHKHLLTVQEGVSENQFQEMVNAKVQLVVPKSLLTKYPPSIRQNLQTLESFIGDIRAMNLP
jgi:EcoRII C terminal/Restriction endonuclease EcoRII, N-terminal